MFHRIFYRFGVIILSAVILSCVLMVLVVAQVRRSGQTGMDASQIVKMRYEAEQQEVSDADLGDAAGLSSR